MLIMLLLFYLLCCCELVQLLQSKWSNYQSAFNPIRLLLQSQSSILTQNNFEYFQDVFKLWNLEFNNKLLMSLKLFACMCVLVWICVCERETRVHKWLNF